MMLQFLEEGIRPGIPDTERIRGHEGITTSKIANYVERTNKSCEVPHKAVMNRLIYYRLCALT